jgi:hypothetical protein
MNYIKSVKEKKENGVFVCYFLTQNDGTVWSVPLAEENTHYQDILEWEKIEGNTIEEAD